MPRAATNRVTEVINDTKRILIPDLNRRIAILQAESPQWSFCGSILYQDSSYIMPNPTRAGPPNIAIITRDPTEAALSWQDQLLKDTPDSPYCPVVNMANATKAGGDWETVTNGPEELLARRSNLSVALRTRLGTFDIASEHYPIPEEGGLYSPCVCK
jgi:hypothetical protein